MNEAENIRVSQALAVAERAHRYQIYEGLQARAEDEPYIFHPIRVSQRVPGTSQKIVALLHDLLEDTDYNLPDFLTITEKEAIRKLTHRNGTYHKYIYELLNATGKSAHIARSVKYADIRENLAHAPEDFEKRSDYEWALGVIQEYYRGYYGRTL